MLPPPSESAELTQWPPLSIYQHSEEVMREGVIRARIFKLIRSPRIDSKEPVPPGCVAWRAGTTNPIPTRFLAPTDCLKILTQLSDQL